jgi:predicted metal-binding protein
VQSNEISHNQTSHERAAVARPTDRFRIKTTSNTTKRARPVRQKWASHTPEYSLPGSTSRYTPLLDDNEEYTRAIVRCGGCHGRLFDLRVADIFAEWEPFAGVPMSALRIIAERKCPHCGMKCEREMTVTDGEPVGDDGQWACPRCTEQGRGGHLARIVSPKGRIILRCPRCKADNRLNTPAVYRELKQLTEDYNDNPF